MTTSTEVMQKPDDLVELGFVSGAYGVRGWVKVQPHSAQADALLNASHWWLQAAPNSLGRVSAESVEPQLFTIQAAKMHSGTVVAQFVGVADRDLAETFKGRTVWVSRAAFPQANEDEYYWVDLIGAQAVNLQGEVLGEVVGLIDNGAHPILRVQYLAVDAKGQSKTDERLIPFVGQYVQSVDIQAKRIVLDWGLDF